MRDFEPMTLGPHICGALSGSKAIPAQHFDTAYHIATSHTHTFLYTYGTVTPTHKARPGKRRIYLKLVQFVGFETGDRSTLKLPKELGRTYLVVLPLCVFSYGSYDGLAISIKEDAK